MRFVHGASNGLTRRTKLFGLRSPTARENGGQRPATGFGAGKVGWLFVIAKDALQRTQVVPLGKRRKAFSVLPVAQVAAEHILQGRF